MTLSPPTFTDGALLSAYALNTLTGFTNQIQGASVATSSIFVTRTTNSTWYMRRRFRYLHVAYSVTLQTASNLDVSIDFGNSTANDYTHGSDVSWQWRTFDLDSVGGVAVGERYGVTVTRSGDDFSFTCEEIRESSYATPNDITAGVYVAPPTWGSAEIVGATKLNQLSSSIVSMDNAISLHSSATLLADDGVTYRMVRRHRYLVVNVTVGGSSPDIDIYVDATKVVNNATTGTHTIDLDAVSGAPSVRDGYSVTVAKTAGTVTVNALEESPTTPTDYAPLWAHGNQMSTATAINTYATVLNSAYAILGDVGWQFPSLYRPYEHPYWTAHKTGRYLHYMRNGALPASILDPTGVNDAVGLTRTSNSDPFAVYDLDTIGWLVPGGLFYVYEADVVWLDDEP